MTNVSLILQSVLRKRLLISREDFPHLAVLNAFTKIYAMAGLRLGYLVSSNVSLCEKINFLKAEWNVSTITQSVGKSVLCGQNYIKETRKFVKKEREFLEKEPKAFGFKVFPPEANFILVKLMDDNFKNNVKMSEKVDNCTKNCCLVSI